MPLARRKKKKEKEKERKCKKMQEQPAVVKGAEQARVGPGIVGWVDGILSVKIARSQLVSDAAGNHSARSKWQGHSNTHQPGEHLLKAIMRRN